MVEKRKNGTGTAYENRSDFSCLSHMVLFVLVFGFYVCTLLRCIRFILCTCMLLGIAKLWKKLMCPWGVFFTRNTMSVFSRSVYSVYSCVYRSHTQSILLPLSFFDFPFPYNYAWVYFNCFQFTSRSFDPNVSLWIDIICIWYMPGIITSIGI